MDFHAAFLVALILHPLIIQLSNYCTGLQCLRSACKLVTANLVLKEILLSSILSKNTILERAFVFERITFLQLLRIKRHHVFVQFAISCPQIMQFSPLKWVKIIYLLSLRYPSRVQTFTEKLYWCIAE